jgi:hypothetical protein
MREREANQVRVGLYGKPGQFRAGIHEALAQGITALGWRPFELKSWTTTRSILGRLRRGAHTLLYALSAKMSYPWPMERLQYLG